MANALKSRSEYEHVEWKRAGLLEGNSKGKLPWPKSRWRWLLPLLLLLFVILAVGWTILHIQGDIEEAAEQILQNQGIDTADLEFDADYRDIQIEGEFPAGTDIAALEQILEDEVGLEDDNDENNDFDDEEDNEDIRKATITATFAAAAALADLTVDVTSDGESITLVGTVPSQEHRSALVSEAEATGLPVDAERLTVSGGEPESADPDGQIAQLATVFGGLAAGSFLTADLTIGNDGPVSGTIEAATASDEQALSALAGNSVDVSSPPVLGAIDTDLNYDGTRIVLNGTVLSEEHSMALADAAADIVGSENVINNLEVSGLDEAVEGADDRVAALATTIGTFGGLSEATATMNDTDLTVIGEAFDDASQAAANSAVTASEASGLRPGGEITVAIAPEPDLSLEEEINLLQAELDALQDEIRENVVFATDSAELTPAAQGTLDKVIDAMNRYMRPVVEVGGHTDSQGNDLLNEELSQRRADSVVAYIAQSIEAERLSPTGFGETQPIADNNLEAGRLQNRRVELTAKENF